MSLSQIFKRVILPCAAGVAAIDDGHTYGPNCAKKREAGTKPSDLPVYSKDCSVCQEESQAQPPPGGFEEAVGKIRRELWVWQDSLRGYRQEVVESLKRGRDTTQYWIEYLRMDSHQPQRWAAISLAGLTGYLLGGRRKFRRIVYGVVGAGAMASLCYPYQASDYLESVVLEGRRVFIVTYHFIFGETQNMPGWLKTYMNLPDQNASEESKMKELPSDAKDNVSAEEKSKKN